MRVLVLYRSPLDCEMKEGYEKVFSLEGESLAWTSTPDLDSKEGFDLLLLLETPEVIPRVREDLHLRGVPLVYMGGDFKSTTSLQDVDLLLPILPPEELLNRLKAFQKRLEWERSRSPLTGLPGGKVIEGELSDRILRKFGWVFYVDLNEFKAYNDSYGFKKGDSVILFLSKLLVEMVKESFPGGGFVGHIGGDDFIFMTVKDEGIGSRVDFEFDRQVSQFYSKRDLERGFIESRDREGRRSRFGIMTLVLTGISLSDSGLSTLEDLSKEMARLKKIAKGKAKALHRSVFLNGHEEGRRGSVETLEEIILHPEKPLPLRRAALEALGELDDQDAHPLFLQVLRESESPMMRKSAAYGLGRLRDRRALIPLIRALQDTSPHVRTRAAEALGTLGDEEAIQHLLEIHGDQNPFVRRATIEALGRLSTESHDQALEKRILSLLVERLQDRDRGVRTLAAKAIGELGRPAGVEPLLEVYPKGDRLLQFSILKSLGKIEEEKSIAFLIERLKEEDEKKREESSNSLYLLSLSPKMAKGIPVQPLLPFLLDRSPSVRRAIVRTLGNIGDPTAVPSILQLLRDEETQVLLQAIAALGSLKDKRGKGPLVVLLRDPKEAVRGRAAWALGEIRDRGALESLRICLKDSSEEVRENAALAIQKILTTSK